ncbi:MAG: ABC transporter ATP-binding protein [Anaerolineae bacterium]|nr:ABC transporter ATP-binding protein [Anaerolineae bacterium]MDW8171833.1 ABC transporter ATP-binding protein [Anaerolineae bacterium]
MTPDVELRQVVKEFSAAGKSKRAGYQVRAVDNVNLQIAQGEFFAMLGPSGCGKTTTLRMIAGFETPTSGEIYIRGKAVHDIPPFHRPVNTVFQDYALFPHMTVIQNVMFGLRMEGVPRQEAQRRAEEALDMVKLSHAAARRPNQLSGGQQQRVALARALVKRPSVLLLDEPLGALDLKLRKEMQAELKTMQQRVGITFIFVTHDQEEAMSMANRIAVMHEGHVLQVGTARDIYERPVNRFVADFIGETNFFVGNLVEKRDKVGVVKLADGATFEASLPLDASSVSEGKVTVALRPERIGIFPPGEEDDMPREVPLNVLEGVLYEMDYIGTDTRYTVEIAGTTLVVREQNVDYEDNYDFRLGQTVKIFFPAVSATILQE